MRRKMKKLLIATILLALQSNIALGTLHSGAKRATPGRMVKKMAEGIRDLGEEAKQAIQKLKLKKELVQLKKNFGSEWRTFLASQEAVPRTKQNIDDAVRHGHQSEQWKRQQLRRLERLIERKKRNLNEKLNQILEKRKALGMPLLNRPTDFSIEEYRAFNFK